MRMNRKWKRRALLASAILLVVSYLVVFQVAPSIILHPRRINDATLISYFGRVPRPDTSGQQATYLTVDTKDGVSLSTWLLQPTLTPAKGTLIFIHGIGGSKEFELKYAETFVAIGMNAVVFDLRAHGKSGGEDCTYGFYEKHDVSAIIDALEKWGIDGKIGLHGTSLGGAIAIQAAAADERIDFLVIESTFATLEEVTFEYMDRISPVSSKLISDWALAAAGRKGHFDPNEVQPELAAAQLSVPVWMAHGTEDVHIPMKYGKRNFEELKSLDKVWREVSGADHNSVRKVGGETYQQEVKSFILNQLPHSQ